MEHWNNEETEKHSKWNIGTRKKQKNIKHETLEQLRNKKTSNTWNIETIKKQKNILYMEHWNKVETEKNSIYGTLEHKSIRYLEHWNKEETEKYLIHGTME